MSMISIRRFNDVLPSLGGSTVDVTGIVSFHSLLHFSVVRFNSPLHDVTVRFDSPLHLATVRWLSTAKCSGKILLPAVSCNGEIWLLLNDAAGRFLQKSLTWLPCSIMGRRDLTPRCKMQRAVKLQFKQLHEFETKFEKKIGYSPESKVGTFDRKNGGKNLALMSL